MGLGWSWSRVRVRVRVRLRLRLGVRARVGVGEVRVDQPEGGVDAADVLGVARGVDRSRGRAVHLVRDRVGDTVVG